MILVPSAQIRSFWAPVAAHRFTPLVGGLPGVRREANILCHASQDESGEPVPMEDVK